MTNLVTRLRDISFNGLRLDEIGYKIIDEAADEIERQQSELKLQREWRERAESDLASAQEQIGRLRHGLDTVVRWSEPNTRVREICEETLAGRQHEPECKHNGVHQVYATFSICCDCGTRIENK